ncbi:MAG: ABC transporter substrate-binding protein [Acetobacteraceae bacterium]
MTERLRQGFVAFLLLAAALLGAVPARAAGKVVSVAYLGLVHDPRYQPLLAYHGLNFESPHRPYLGALLGLKDANDFGGLLGISFRLAKVDAKDAAGLVAAIGAQKAKGTRIFLLDAPGPVAAAVAKATRGQHLLLFNVSARSDALRGPACQRQMLDTIPSRAMLSDALAQYLVARKWRRVLMLVGPGPQDAENAAAFRASAHKFGLRIVAERKFIISEDPRNRARNNLALLTGGVSYDTVYIADQEGEYALELPYQTQLPRLVIGSSGLRAVAWHWAWQRFGAPQVTRRFWRLAKVQRMTSADFAAWIAMKIVALAAVRTHSADFAKIDAYIRRPQFQIDVYKGLPASFRSWDNQLRQPILLATHAWVIGAAPLPGFLHPVTDLDTLGIDKPQSTCHF